jgi:UDP-2-acetamido-2-deoxy-ribo-hexuluronate aminotransferase
MPVPFIDLKRLEDGFLDRWLDRCRDITTNTRYVGGPDVARLEARLAEAGGVAAVVGCANGTDALQLALRAAGVGIGDVVLIPDATFWATFEAVVNVGARPVTVDIDPSDLQMDFDRFGEALERFRPRAAILVHLYGWASHRLADFRALCAARGVPLIEDGAQAFGLTVGGASIFREAWLSTVSFYPAKVLGACGDAGAVYCRTHELAEVVRSLGNHGRSAHYAHGRVGWNSRLGGLDAAFLDLSLDYLEARLASRRGAAARYRRELAPLGVRTVAPPDGHVENGYLNVCLVDPARRPAIEAALRGRGIGFGNVYPGAMSEQPGAAGPLAGRVGGEQAAMLGRSVLNLPLFAYITDAEIAEVVSAVGAATGTAVGKD